MASGTTVVLAFATAFTALGLLFLALSFGTDHWLEYTVDREDLATAGVGVDFLAKKFCFSRDRGLFRTCYPGDEAKFLDDIDEDDIVDGSCLLEDGYQLTSDDEKSDWGDDYDTRIHLMRCHVAFFIFAMILVVVGCIVGAVGCWKLSGSFIRIAGLIVFVGAFLNAGGMAFFHGYEYLERQKIRQEQPEFPAFWNKETSSDYVALQANSTIRYGYSYYFGWMGMALAAVAAILYLCAAHSLQPRSPRRRFYDDYPPKPRHRDYAPDYPSRTGYAPDPYRTGFGPDPMMNPGYATTPYYPSKPYGAPPPITYPTLPALEGPRGYVY